MRRRALVDGRSSRRLAVAALLATVLAVLVALEYLGLLSGVNSMVFRAVGRPGLVVAELVSATASIPAFAVYAVALPAYDVARRGRVSLGTVSLGVSLAVAMVFVAVLKASLQVPRPGGAAAPPAAPGGPHGRRLLRPPLGPHGASRGSSVLLVQGQEGPSESGPLDLGASSSR